MLTKLRSIQQRDRLTDAQMAERLGTARSTWTEVKNGRIVLSERLQLAAARAFPELLGELLTSVTPQGVEKPVAAQ